MDDKRDCGDNSCKYAAKKGGMRTNGGCSCDAGSLRDWQWCERCHIHVDGGGPQRTRRPDDCVYVGREDT